MAAVYLCPAAASAGVLDPTDTATGTGALSAENGGSYNTADGYFALHSNTTGSSNTAVGGAALQFNTTGYNNTASGVDALDENTTGNFNTASGMQALSLNTTGSYNTASGGNALLSNTTGGYNTASGYSALYFNTTGGYVTASGAFALYSNTTGNFNAAYGYSALNKNTTGAGNVAVGYQALNANVGGNQDVAVGINALAAATGSNNIAVGTRAGSKVTTGNGNIHIGNFGVANDSHVTRIGSGQTRTFIAGIKGMPLKGASVVITASGQLGVVASSARYKRDIAPLSDSADKLARLRPVSFRYKTEPETTHYGLIAEEVDKVMPELVVRDEENRPESVQYQELIPLLLQQWKAQQAEIARERKLIAQQGETIDRLSARVEDLSRTRLAGRSLPK